MAGQVTTPLYDDAPMTWGDILRATRDNECCCDTCEGLRNLAAMNELPVARRHLRGARWAVCISAALGFVATVIVFLALLNVVEL